MFDNLKYIRVGGKNAKTKVCKEENSFLSPYRQETDAQVRHKGWNKNKCIRTNFKSLHRRKKDT